LAFTEGLKEGSRRSTDKLTGLFAENLLYMLTGNEPDPLYVDIMDTCLILHAEHTINASTFAALVTGSTLASPYGVVAAADMLFLLAFTALVIRPLIDPQHRRQFMFVPILLALIGANVMTHLGIMGFDGFGLDWGLQGLTLGLDAHYCLHDNLKSPLPVMHSHQSNHLLSM